MTGLWPQGLTEVLLGMVELSFLSVADDFLAGVEDEPALEGAAEDIGSCLGHLQAGFSVLTVEVPAWLDGAGEEGSWVLRFFGGEGSEGPIIDVFRSLASLAEKGPF